MNILNIVTSPRKEKSASTAVVNAFLREYRERVRDVLDQLAASLPNPGRHKVYPVDVTDFTGSRCVKTIRA